MRESLRLRIPRLPQLLLMTCPLKSPCTKLKYSRLRKMTSLSQIHLQIMRHLRISRIHRIPRIRARQEGLSPAGIMVTEIIP